ncbi:uncharacterized protein BCR38DRAFT_488184 [Pseudomassariella vexata]|uniref:Uncharacterized protein n=1 Tax=Pseudomassariella vexata TaxID=1141098 RepID=A0A1Y2DLG8_9PEZI|nr:uncharacterized protein BCR38DRAFT_488184 [Pseudomassariella vexata]ORY59999.1 hypothetical protein BCR38DRAFT_488184 [Pseudomassariella vexata]
MAAMAEFMCIFRRPGMVITKSEGIRRRHGLAMLEASACIELNSVQELLLSSDCGLPYCIDCPIEDLDCPYLLREAPTKPKHHHSSKSSSPSSSTRKKINRSIRKVNEYIGTKNGGGDPVTALPYRGQGFDQSVTERRATVDNELAMIMLRLNGT